MENMKKTRPLYQRSQDQIIFEKKYSQKKGKMFFQGIGDHKNFFIYPDLYQTEKLGKEVWILDIKPPQLI
jgi:hypothetical protein